MASSTRTHQGRRSRNTANEQEYFRWLTDRVQEDGHPRKTYGNLFRMLYDTEFVWIIPNDDNRVMDGLDLRVEFFHSRVALRKPCSVLEVLVALSRRLAWLAGGSAEGWAWQLLCNLELHKFRDPISQRKTQQVDEILYALIWRTYYPDGTGGFFPLTWPKEDQTKVEIWYQMHAYVKEIRPDY
jgi:hypothetical protein